MWTPGFYRQRLTCAPRDSTRRPQNSRLHGPRGSQSTSSGRRPGLNSDRFPTLWRSSQAFGEAARGGSGGATVDLAAQNLRLCPPPHHSYAEIYAPVSRCRAVGFRGCVGPGAWSGWSPWSTCSCLVGTHEKMPSTNRGRGEGISPHTESAGALILGFPASGLFLTDPRLRILATKA